MNLIYFMRNHLIVRELFVFFVKLYVFCEIMRELFVFCEIMRELFVFLRNYEKE